MEGEERPAKASALSKVGSSSPAPPRSYGVDVEGDPVALDRDLDGRQAIEPLAALVVAQLDGGLEVGPHLLEDREAVRLILGQEALEGVHVVDAFESFEACGHLAGLVEILGQNLDGPGGTLAVGEQLLERLDRFDARIANVHMIDVESHPGQGDAAHQGDGGRRAAHDAWVADREGGQLDLEPATDRPAPPRGFSESERDERGVEGQGCEEPEQDAGAGDDPHVRDAGVGGGNEGVEAARGGQRAQKSELPSALAGSAQRRGTSLPRRRCSR